MAPNGHCVTEGETIDKEQQKLSAAAVPSPNVSPVTPTEDYLWEYAPLRKFFWWVIVITALTVYLLGLPAIWYPVILAVNTLPLFGMYIGIYNFLYARRFIRNRKSKIDQYINFHDAEVEKRYSGQFMPVREFYEFFADEKLSPRGDLLECLEKRDEFLVYKVTWWHLKFYLGRFIPEMLIHSTKQDKEQVCDHYDRGNDFYNYFLGPMMIYTSGIMKNRNDTLEEMQMNKLKKLCDEQLCMQPGDKHLDIGCGWGTLVNHAAQMNGTLSTGITIAKEQVEWAELESSRREVKDRTRFLNMDYRDIPQEKYNKITCLEMSEHVGIKLYSTFMKQVYDLLEEDGLFYLQIAGIRRAWQWEDVFWAFFMDTYIFPGADASLPLTFPVAQLEAAGFELASVETIGIHYSETIRRWYNNWESSEAKEVVSQKYGNRIYRVWEMFLAWSTIIARQGNSTCYQIVAHKNRNKFDRTAFIKGY